MSKNARWRPNPSQTRVQAAIANRLVELKSDPCKAARKGNLPYSYIYEVVTGKKRSFSAGSINKMAEALEWSVNDLSAILSGNEPQRAGTDPLERPSAEGAFEALAKTLRPDLTEEMPALVQLFRTLVQMPPEPQSTAPLVDQMFLRAQISARRFAPKIAATTESPRRAFAPPRNTPSQPPAT